MSCSRMIQRVSVARGVFDVDAADLRLRGLVAASVGP